jgi:hypothetical protein
MLFRDKLVILILSVVPRPQKLVISMKMKHNLNYQLPISDTEYGATPSRSKEEWREPLQAPLNQKRFEGFERDVKLMNHKWEL